MADTPYSMAASLWVFARAPRSATLMISSRNFVGSDQEAGATIRAQFRGAAIAIAHEYSRIVPIGLIEPLI